MTREDFNKMSLDEIQTECQKEITELEATLEGKSLDELKSDEALLMDVFKENDEYIKNVTYKLPETVSMEIAGAKINVPQKDIRKYISEFLSTIQSEWKTSLGIYNLIVFWDGTESEIPYGTMDSTLRTLGSVVKYQGRRELENIYKVNNFLSVCHTDFIKDSIYIQYLSAQHEAIMKCMEAIEKLNNTDENSKKEPQQICD